MPWTDEQANCVLEVCCGKDGKQLQALTQVLRDEAGLPPPMALSAATFLVQTFDFALKGSLYQFKQDIAKFARGNAYE
jgi:hypothetical protein